MDQDNGESKKNVQQKRYIQWIINIVLVAAVVALWIVYLTTRTAIGYVDNAQLLNKSAMVQQAQAEIQVKIDEFRQEITKQEGLVSGRSSCLDGSGRAAVLRPCRVQVICRKGCWRPPGFRGQCNHSAFMDVESTQTKQSLQREKNDLQQ